MEARGVIGGFTTPTIGARVHAADGTRLFASFLPGPASSTAVLLAHGFGANRRKPAYARLAEALATVIPVLTLDLRGHGGSAGRSTFGDREREDVLGGLRWLAGAGYRHQVAIGVSMGATAVIRAGASGVDLAGMVTVSGPAWFRTRAPEGPLVRLETLWHSPWRRAGVRAALGIDLAAPSAFTATEHPAEAIARVRAPLLVVHGRDDAYFPLDDARALAAGAGGQATLWAEPDGFGHAEDGLTPAFVARLAAAVEQVIVTGRFPADPAGGS